MLGITLGVVERRKNCGKERSGQVLSCGKVEGRSLVEFLGVKVGTEVGPCDGMSEGRDFWNVVVWSWTKKWMDIHWDIHLVHNMEIRGVLW